MPDPLVSRKAELAAVMSDSGRALTHAELENQSIRLSRLLDAGGLVPGDRVAILMENNLEWFIAMWGARRAGMFFVPVNWHLTENEVRYVLENSDAHAILTTAKLLDLAVAASAGLDDVRVRLAVGANRNGFRDFAAALAACPAEPLAVELDGGSMPYSSGTTGFPKGVLRELTDDRFGRPNALETMLAATYAIDADSIYLSPAPTYHSSPVGFTQTVLIHGGTLVVMPSFDPEAALAAVERYRVTHAQFVPTHFVRMLRLRGEGASVPDLSSLRFVIHAAAPCAPDIKRAMIEWMGPVIYEYYSGSESCGLTAITSGEWLEHPGSVGRSLRGVIHILDLETGEELPSGEVGAIYFEDPAPVRYHKDPAKTAAIFNDRGWGTLGDVGWVDDEGFLYMSDRRSDLILSGGVNIYPQEVENAVNAHPAVADSAVIGLPNAEYGQEVCAVVQRLPGAHVDEKTLIAHCRDRLAGFKCPRSIRFTEALPRLPNGKLLRRKLIETKSSNARKY